MSVVERGSVGSPRSGGQSFQLSPNFVSGTQKMFLILFRNILCTQQMFPSLRSPRNIMGNNVSPTMCPRLPGPLKGMSADGCGRSFIVILLLLGFLCFDYKNRIVSAVAWNRQKVLASKYMESQMKQNWPQVQQICYQGQDRFQSSSTKSIHF